ncbi:hypothetical protein EHQ86_00340 [Leptospira yasudae]|nr:hypothetical protein EHQ86_00340 [Leptospira yasudae]
MDHLLAKTKGRDGNYFKVISNKRIFDMPDDLSNSVEYDSDYKLEEDEWFSIADFSQREYCIDFLKKRFISTDYNQIAQADYINVEYFVSYQAGVYYFQKFLSSQIIRKKYFSISEQPDLVDSPIIVINQVPDAIYIKDDDTLYFKKLPAITTIFKGIYELYKEATQEETKEFLQNKFIDLDEEFTADNVKRANRKRIAMAQETLKKFKPKEKKQIFSYIREYCVDLEFDEDAEKFFISNEEDLKKLLYGIEQRYYTTMIGNEKRLANSITTV